MGAIQDITGTEAFRDRLVSARGDADHMMVYRGDHPGQTADDGRNGAAVAQIDGILEDIERATGLRTVFATASVTDPRTVIDILLGIPGVPARLLVSHDTVRALTDVSLVHDEAVDMEHPSLVDLVHSRADTTMLVDLQFGEAAPEVHGLLERLAMRPAPVAGETLRQRVASMELVVLHLD